MTDDSASEEAKKPMSGDSWVTIASGVITLFFIAAVVSNRSLPPMQRFLDHYWPWLLLGLAIVVILLASLSSAQNWFRGPSPPARVALTLIALSGLIA
jgi:hypothetical protein